ncbi:hypothetical protein D915_001304 [Fasciola hepatica]|uniref:Uncharacterized protein n=1 Tax=Fasciola hepatica TaxID=6192 RepID=A0A4E0RZ81_FASHE|nr:hypothetical protein D915_001304 [Fasciola hepatica]
MFGGFRVCPFRFLVCLFCVVLSPKQLVVAHWQESVLVTVEPQNTPVPYLDHIKDLLNAVIDGIERTLTFLLNNVNEINLDGIIGPSDVEGSTNALLVRYWQRMPYSLVRNLIRIRQLAHAVGEAGIRVVSEKMPFYYSRVYHQVQPYSWALYRPPGELNYSLKWTESGKKDDFEEKVSDDCMHELINKSEDGRCSVSPQCWQMVTSDQRCGYSLTHQVIYILTGINSGCLEDLEYLSKLTTPERSLDKLLQTLCTRIMIEANHIAAAEFALEYRDLFMEQIGVCGEAGFVDQTELSWLEKILSWQAPSGCYYQFDHENLSPENFKPHMYGSYRRRKRAEKRIKGSESELCLAHRTAVALIAMQSFLVRFVETLYGLHNQS